MYVVSSNEFLGLTEFEGKSASFWLACVSDYVLKGRAMSGDALWMRQPTLLQHFGVYTVPIEVLSYPTRV